MKVSYIDEDVGSGRCRMCWDWGRYIFAQSRGVLGNNGLMRIRLGRMEVVIFIGKSYTAMRCQGGHFLKVKNPMESS